MMHDEAETGGADRGRGFVLGLLAGAGVVGALGVACAAVAAHKVESPALATASTMLMIHAGTALGLAAVSAALQSTTWAWLGVVMLTSVTLFAAPIVANAMGLQAVPMMIAPVGGSLLIASWASIAVVAVVTALRSR